MKKLIACAAIVAACCLPMVRAADDAKTTDAKTAADKNGAKKTPEATAQKLLAHNVYVALKDNSDEAKKQFVESCKKYLSQHSGIVFFAVGTSTNAQGQFNDKEFDISLNMVFTSKAALDTYARSEQHQKFLAENMAGIKGVRVFDADVERTSVPDDKK